MKSGTELGLKSMKTCPCNWQMSPKWKTGITEAMNMSDHLPCPKGFLQYNPVTNSSLCAFLFAWSHKKVKSSLTEIRSWRFYNKLTWKPFIASIHFRLAAHVINLLLDITCVGNRTRCCWITALTLLSLLSIPLSLSYALSLSPALSLSLSLTHTH